MGKTCANHGENSKWQRAKKKSRKVHKCGKWQTCTNVSLETIGKSNLTFWKKICLNLLLNFLQGGRKRKLHENQVHIQRKNGWRLFAKRKFIIEKDWIEEKEEYII